MKRALVAAMLIVSSAAIAGKAMHKQQTTGERNGTLADDSRIPAVTLTASGNPAPPFPTLTASGNPAPPDPRLTKQIEAIAA